MEVPNGGYEIETSHCDNNTCDEYSGNVTPDNIWYDREFYLRTANGKVQKVKVGEFDWLNLTVGFSFDNQGNKVNLDVGNKNCRVTDEGFLCIEEDNQGHKFKVLIKKKS